MILSESSSWRKSAVAALPDRGVISLRSSGDAYSVLYPMGEERTPEQESGAVDRTFSHVLAVYGSSRQLGMVLGWPAPEGRCWV
jgi:hypothetical protein